MSERYREIRPDLSIKEKTLLFAIPFVAGGVGITVVNLLLQYGMKGVIAGGAFLGVLVGSAGAAQDAILSRKRF